MRLFKSLPFLINGNTCISFMDQYVCPVFRICVANVDVFFSHIVRMFRVSFSKDRPV
jgi:hypothetical protein